MKKDIEIIDAKRDPITREEMLRLMGWSWGVEGVQLAKLWQGLNEKHFDDRLIPLPIWFPSTFPYGCAIGLFSANFDGESLHIQIKRGMEIGQKANVLLHEMIHQSLSESGQDPSHNGTPWCEEIMRLAKEIWDVSIWASPCSPRKIGGKSQRIQKESSGGDESISRKAIATFPDSLGLNVDIKNYL